MSRVIEIFQIKSSIDNTALGVKLYRDIPD